MHSLLRLEAETATIKLDIEVRREPQRTSLNACHPCNRGRNAREQLRTVYAKELTQQLVKNNFFVLPVCLSEILPFTALNSTCMRGGFCNMNDSSCLCLMASRYYTQQGFTDALTIYLECNG
eukprot:scaffold207397_cov52-Cyclotella_meneghiniana.AAC.1